MVPCFKGTSRSRALHCSLALDPSQTTNDATRMALDTTWQGGWKSERSLLSTAETVPYFDLRL